MLKRLYPIIVTLSLLFASLTHSDIARADFWGGDLPLLAQILTQAIQEVTLLQQSLQVAQGDAELLKQANKDIQTALTEIYALQDIVRDTTSLGKIRDPNELLIRLKGIYGQLPRIGNTDGYTFSDQVAGNGLGVDNDTYEHAHKIDDAAIKIQGQAKGASPGKAQQLTAQAQAVSLHSLAQIERSTATSVRIAATNLAIENQHEKEKANTFDEGYSAMVGSGDEKSDITLGSLN
jgi:hypothetical protein